jgi:hypothetical protein
MCIINTTFSFGLLCFWDHVKWVPCHHGTARPQVANVADGLQVAADVLNKQSRTADRGWSSSLGVGRGSNYPQQ